MRLTVPTTRPALSWFGTIGPYYVKDAFDDELHNL
jgi:hypothetical protein